MQKLKSIRRVALLLCAGALLPLFACGKVASTVIEPISTTPASIEIATTKAAATDSPESWQEVYTAILRANNDAVGNKFFLVDADGNGTPELYRVMNFRGNEVYVSDFARGTSEVFVSSLSISELYYNNVDSILGVYHCDGGPAGEEGMPYHECFSEYRYADGSFICIARLLRNWVTQDIDGKINISELDNISLDREGISLKEYETHVVHFQEKHSTSYSSKAEMHFYKDSMDLNACWIQ